MHDTLELAGWDVEIADAAKVKGLGSQIAGTRSRRDSSASTNASIRSVLHANGANTPEVRAERERARFRLHLVKHRSALKCRIHATLLAFGYPNPVSDLFGKTGREILDEVPFPQPWRDNVNAAKTLIDDLTVQIADIEADLAAIARTHPYVRLLDTTPGIGLVLGYTIASEIGDISRFETPRKLAGYTGLCPRVHQSGGTDRRGPLAKNGPRYLRWALMEAAVHASGSVVYRDHYRRTRARLGRQRGPKIARVEVARKLSEAIWHMLTRGEPFAPAGAASALAS